jgi:hypothetical protein
MSGQSISTPRTDAAAGYPDSGGCWKYHPQGEYVDAETCREIERELSTMKAKLHAFEKIIIELSD